MALDKNNILKQVLPNDKTKPSVLRLVSKTLAGASIHDAPAAEEAKESVYSITKERSGVDPFTSSEKLQAADLKKALDDRAKENTKKTNYLKQLQNGQLFAQAENDKDSLIMQLLKESLPDDIKEIIKQRTNGENDPETVFTKAQNNPVKVAESLKHIYPQQIQEMIDEAQDRGDADEVSRLQNVLTNINSIFNIAEMDNLGEPQHMALLGYVAELSDQGLLSEEVSKLVDKTHKSYEKLAENEDRISGVLTKIKNDISETLAIGPKGDKQLRNKVAIYVGAILSDKQANGQVFFYNDDEAVSNAVPFEPEMLNAPGLSLVTTRLLSKHIAPAWNRIYVGHLTQEQPFANIAMLDTPDRWIPNDANV